MPKVVWTSENDRKLLIRLIERSAKSYDTVELCKIFPGATPKAIEERIAKLKREAKAMDHPKPRNHPKGKSGPKKRVASLASPENADTKRIKVADSTGSVTDSTPDPAEDLLSSGIPDTSDALYITKTEDEEPSLEPANVKSEPEPELDFGSEVEPEVSPEAESSVEPSVEPDDDPDFELDSESEIKSEDEEADDWKPYKIKQESGTLEEF